MQIVVGVVVGAVVGAVDIVVAGVVGVHPADTLFFRQMFR